MKLHSSTNNHIEPHKTNSVKKYEIKTNVNIQANLPHNAGYFGCFLGFYVLSAASICILFGSIVFLGDYRAADNWSYGTSDIFSIVMVLVGVYLLYYLYRQLKVKRLAEDRFARLVHGQIQVAKIIALNQHKLGLEIEFVIETQKLSATKRYIIFEFRNLKINDAIQVKWVDENLYYVV